MANNHSNKPKKHTLADRMKVYKKRFARLDKKTKISGAVIGGILLAAVTSLPELFTSFSSVLFIGNNEMVVGNILGSDLFNLMITGITTVVFIKNFKNAKIEKTHLYTILIVIAMTGISLYAILVPDQFQPKAGPINFLTLLIIGLYVLNVLIQPKTKDDEEEKEESTLNLSVKQIIVRFIICAVLLVGVSIAITYVTDIVAKELKLDATVAGSLFLAIATSLPEVVSSITLCYKRNFNAALGNVVGSNAFNFIILAIAEYLSWGSSVFVYQDKEAFLMAIFLIIGSILAITLFLSLFLYQRKERSKTTTILSCSVFVILGVLILSCYIAYLLVNN